jgi:hypothetical protein
MTAKDSTETTRLSPETVYSHAMAPEDHDYDVPAELDTFMHWLRRYSASVQPTAAQGKRKSHPRDVSTVPMTVDLRVHDDVALGEIELYAEVLTAVAASESPLSREELDVALGVDGKDAQGHSIQESRPAAKPSHQHSAEDASRTG